MARPPTTFTDTELRDILAAAAAAESSAIGPSNADFLDRFIAGVTRSTGRLYGQPVYERLLGAAGIARRPSAQTWLKAINRHRAADLVTLSPAPLPSAGTAVAAAPAAPVVEHASDLSASLVPVNELVEWKTRVQVAETTVRDAYKRLTALESERAALIERSTAAEAIARQATQQCERERVEHERQTTALLARIEGLTVAVERLAGLDRHLRLQTDALRQEMSQQVQFWKARSEALDKTLAQERSQTDAMRRVLSNRSQQ